VESYSEVEFSSDGSTIYGGSETDIDYGLWDEGYWAAVEGDLYDNGNWVDSDYEEGDLAADAYTQAQVYGGDSYGLTTTSGYCYEYDEDGDYECDPVTYSVAGANTGAPSISSISPNTASVGTSGQITVNGSYLTGSGAAPTVTVTGSGDTMSVNSGTASSTALDLNYALTTSATTGQQTITLKNNWGTATASFTVSDPSPTITGISPSTWIAGNSYNITITGNNFGTAPSISITGPSGSISANVTSGSDTSIAANISVPANSASGPASVTVTSTGFGGSGFFPGNGGSASSSSTTPQVVAVTPPLQIIFNGNNISGTTQSVQPGQQIALTVTAPAPYTINPGSVTWNITNQSAANGGFVNGVGTIGTQPSASGGGSVAALPAMNQNAFTFYWVKPGDNGETVTCTYTLNNGQSASATATFNVGGPTGVVLQPTMKTDGTGVQVLSTSYLSTTGVTVTTPQGVTGKVGIDFKASANPPSNYNQTYTFVQVLNGVQQKYITSNGQYPVQATPTVGIDKTYPYAYVYPTETWDTPATGLPGSYGEGWETFTATMYLMWDPAIPPSGQPSCTPAKTVQNADGSFTSTASNCASIPVPLSSVTWHWSGCALNTLVKQSNQTTWALSTAGGCPVDTLGTVQSAGFPEWPPLSN
jgi:hypothetical protein